jgi:pimeloyl-ACP methyl ester carboxylesterase
MSSSQAPVTDHFITINGINLHYRDWGDPQLLPLVILHGGGNSISRSWDHVAAALADRFRIIVPDLRGNGESSWASEYSWELILDDTLELMDKLGVRQTVLCGHSMGGRVAYMLASQHPERLTRLVIVEAAPWDPKVQIMKITARVENSKDNHRPRIFTNKRMGAPVFVPSWSYSWKVTAEPKTVNI